MPSYTVQSGDTLSGIGASHGVDWHSITGFRSGNPNLIYPGEVVSWGSSGPSRPASRPTARPAAQPAPVARAAGEARNWQNKANGLYNQVGDFDANAQNPIDIYNSALESLGIGDARTRVTGLRESLLNTENLIKNVQGDVASRTANSLVTENQKRRLVAMDRAPLDEAAATEGRNLEVALSDYHDIMTEGKAQTDYEYQGQKDKRSALMDRYKMAIENATSAEEKRRYEQDYARLIKKDAEEARQWAKEFQLKQAKFAYEKSKPRGGSGGASTADKNAFNKARNETISFLDKYKGGDGFVSPHTFQDARRGWLGKGQDPRDFNDIFGGWVNRSHSKDYY